jgi:hypothetical protein
VLAIGQTALQSRTKANDITVAAIADELEARAAERRAAAMATGTATVNATLTRG